MALPEFLAGAGFLASLGVALFFARYWRQHRDRLLGIFALAFGVFAINRLVLTFVGEEQEWLTALYLVRALAFLLIVVAIIDKNSTRR